MVKAKYGDIIYTKHEYYRHFAIYINENRVIHYDGKIDNFWLQDMYIRETDMSRFLAGAKEYYIWNGKAKYSPEEVVNRARSKIGESEFNLAFNNCEHFAKWCKSGKHTSTQVSLVGAVLITISLISR